MTNPPLIGVDDIDVPEWATGYAATADAGVGAVVREAPRTVGIAVGWAWRTSPRLTALVAALQLVKGVTTAFGLLATANVFAELLEQGPTPERLLASLPAVAAVVAALAAGGLLDAGVATAIGVLLPHVGRRADEQLHEAMTDVELAAFDDAAFMQLVVRARTEGPMRLRAAVELTGELVASFVAVAAAVTAASVLQPLLAPLVLLAALPQAWASISGARVMFDSVARMNTRHVRMGVTSELITGRDAAAEVRAFTTQPMLLGEHRRIGEELADEDVRVSRTRTRLELTGRALSGVGTGVIYLVLALLIYAGVVPLALAGAAVVAMRTATGAIASIIFHTNQLYEASFALAIFRRCVADARTRRRATAEAAPGEPSVITLDAVTFAYPDQEGAAVRGISATLRRGQVVALVGENGSGKTTLAKLITGLYLPQSGRVAWDGVDTRDAAPAALHDHVAVVLQDPVRWPMSATNNVRVGRIDADDPDDARRTDAARRSGAEAVVRELPGGWSTMLSRRFRSGRDLSGGQWQRISVARGLYRDAAVVVADEPTAALDARAEQAVFATLRALTGTEKITVLVTHRLANVRHADQILVLDGGQLVEQGRHDELMAADGLYAELFGIQAKAYTVGS